MASCIDIKAIERFVADNGIDAAPDLVKHLVFKWQSENNTDTEWPSAEYITEQLRGERFDPSEAQLKLYNALKLNETKSFPTEEALNNYINNNLRSSGIYCFPQSSIYTYRGVTGDYKLSLGLPSNAREKALIKQRAKEDGTFMKAPNGNPTNLTENQWLEVRTKAFKDWFGDWENDPENASKVVDENGEPLIVYHGTRTADKLKAEGFSKDFSGKGNRGANQGYFYFTNSVENAEYTGVKAHELNPLIDVMTSVYDLFNTTDLPTIESLYKTIDTNLEQIRNLESQRRELNSKSIIKRFVDTILDILKLRRAGSEEQINNSIQKLNDLNTELTHKIEVLNLYDSGLSFLKGERNKAVVNTLNFIKESINANSPFRQVAANRLINLLYGTENLTYSPDVLEVFLNIRTPLESDFGMKPTDRNPLKGGRFSGELLAYNQRETLLLEELQNDKYDGSISKNKFDVLFGNVYIVKDSNQIKSATNNIGTYSNINERIDLQENKSDKDTQIDITELPDKIGPEELYSKLEALYDPNSSEGKLAKLIFDSLKSLPITFEKRDDLYGSYGKWVASAKTIMLNSNGIARNTLLHESIHALTSYYLNHPRREELPQQIQIALKEIEHCYKLLVYDRLTSLGHKPKTWEEMEDLIGWTINNNSEYGYKSPEEMVAELSNPDFVRHIRRADNNYRGRNIFKRLIDAVFKLFKTNKEYTSIEKTLKEALVKLITNPSEELYEKYSQENANTKNNLKTFRQSASIQLDLAPKALNKYVISLLEGSPISPEHQYADITVEMPLDVADAAFLLNQSDVEYVADVDNKLLTDAAPGTLLPLREKDLYTAINGKVQVLKDQNKIIVPLRVFNEYFFAYNSFDVVKGANGANLITNVRPLEYKLPKKEQAKKETSLPQLSETTRRPTTQNNVIQRATHDWSRTEAENDPETLYIFTDNTNRTSGGKQVNPNSWYAKKYGTHAKYPTRTQAVLRGLDNAYPVSTQRWFNPAKGLTYAKGNWTDADFEEFKKVIDAEFQDIYDAWNSGKYKRIMIGQGDAILNGAISNITKARVPKLYKYLHDKLVELNNVVNQPHTIELNPLDEIHFTHSNIEFNSIEQAMQTAKWQALRIWLDWYGSKPADTQVKNINKILDAIKEAKTGEEARAAGEVTIKSRSKDVQDLIDKFFGEDDVTIAGLRNWKTLSQRMLKNFKEVAMKQNGIKPAVNTPVESTVESREEKPAAPEETPVIEEITEPVGKEDPVRENVAWKNVLKDPDFQYASMLAEQGRTLTEQWGIPMSRIEEAAIEIGNYISDLITEVQRNPARAKALLGIDLTQDEVERMTRPELITRISPNRLMAQVKKTKFDTSKFSDSQLENEDLVDETDAIFNNWEFVMSRAATIILENEKVQFKYNPRTKTTTAIEKNNEFTNPDDIEGQRLQDGIEETHENQQEWGIESKTLDLLNDVASPLVKDAFRQCYLTDAQGKIVQSERGINKRVRTRDAISQVFAWTVGVQSINDAIQRLKDKSVKAQWLLPIIARLEDTSGRESDFQNQFWTVIRNSNVVYSVVKKTKQGMKAMDVSSNQVRREQISSIKSLMQMGEHPLFGANGINANNLAQFGVQLSSLNDVKGALSDAIKEGKDIRNHPDYKKAVGSVGMIANLLGYYAPEALITENLNNESFDDVCFYITKIGVNLDRGKGNPKYNPFSYDEGSHGIGSYLGKLVGLLSASLQDTHMTSIFDNGKMYQTRVKPSALLTQLAKFQLGEREFKKFLNDTYNLPWFRDTSETDITKGWRLTFMQNLINNPEVRQNLQHQIQLNYNKKQYMKNMNPIEYTLATIAQFLAENPLGGKSTANKYAWFRIPIQSNKPTSEYLKMKCETDAFFRDTITDRMAEIFDQELSRIQTVTLMNAQKGDDKFIKNFSKRGKEFCFLDFMNVYLEGGARANTELGKLIRAKIRGEQIKEGDLLRLKKAAIKKHMQDKVNQMLDSWERTGIAEAVKEFANIGKDVRHALEVFAWNDALASMNIMELFVHDIAFYNGADDLQKRLAELHAPGIRPNLDARDYQGKPVSDGIHRSIMLADAEGLTSNIIDNVSVVFNRRIQNAPESQKKIWEDLKEHLVGEEGLFRDINATDGQAYNSPSSFRKKAIMFGKWDINKERLYQKIRSGKYTPEDVRNAFRDPTFGVLKPTTFGHSRMETGVAPLNQISVPTYNKNSEYTLFMAEALLAGENTGRPNLLRAIFDVMEDSHVGPNGEWKTNGIDTVQFVSAVKSGEGKTIDITSLMEDTDGEAKAKLVLTQAIYNVDKADLAYDTNGRVTTNPYRNVNSNGYNATKLSYNKDIVRELPYDSFALQMDVANHFKEHEQIFGSQNRMIIPSELPEINAAGEEIMYNTPEGPKNAKEFRRIYEETIAANIAESVAQVEEELGLTNDSPIERKAAISKLLQKEIIGNPRYGMDLYLAVSINPATKDFTVPLSDPVNSKRIESLLNSIIKDRINKQMISGGPIVQVTNFGTSKRLGIKFKSKSGGLLKTRKEFNGTDEMYQKYLEENQGGIAYMEVYASPYTNQIFNEFADANGVIDIKAIEAVNPDLLKMIGYRIPTEAKYSISPLKIVGFLPRECGEGIMLPYEITLLNGSDFDVDKMYIMTKRFDINKKRFGLQKGNVTKAVEYLKELPNMAELVSSEGEINTSVLKANREAIMGSIFTKNDLVKELINSIRYRANVTEDEQQSIKEDIEREIQGKIYDYKKKHKTEEVPEEEINKIRGEYNYEEAVETYRNAKTINRVKEFLEEDLYRPSETDGVLTSALRKAYLNFMYKVETPSIPKYQRDNAIIDMQWEVLTNEEVAQELLNPGGFDPQKRMGYIINAYKNGAINPQTKAPYTYDELLSITNLDDLAALSAGSSNLMFFDTQVQYYKQNSAAGSLTGIFAVHRTAHAILEGDGLYVDTDKAGKLVSTISDGNGGGISIHNPVVVLGMKFEGRMPIDVRFSSNGESVGKQLGNSVAAAVDAGKYPVLNLFNVNGITANVYTTLLKMGMPFEDVALFLGQKVISDLLDAHARASVSGYTSIYTLMDELLNALDKKHKLMGSKKEGEDLTREALIKGLRERDDINDYKTIRALRAFLGIANACRLPVAATRLNSVTSAVGPLITDNIINNLKRKELNEESNIYDALVGDTPITFESIVDKHPILREFNKSYSIADRTFADMITNSNAFRNVIEAIGATSMGRTLFNDSRLMSALSDFFQTYLAYANGVVKEGETLVYINEFPKAFAHRRYKEKFKGNAFIDAIQFETKEGSNKVALNVDTTGWDQSLKSPLSSAWLDLYNTNAEGRNLAISLVKYFIHRGGVGFTPKTAMNLVPTLLKEKVPNYNEAFKVKNIPSIDALALLDMFVRNNWDNYKLVPLRKIGDKEKEIKGEFTPTGVTITDASAVPQMQKLLYFRTKRGKEDILLKQKEVILDSLERPVAIEYERISPLGANGDYVEISTTKRSKEATNTLVEKETSVDPYGVESDTSLEYADDVLANRASTANYLITFGDIDRLTTLLLSNNRDLSKAVEKRADVVETSSTDKSLNAQLEQHFNAELEKIGINNEERVNLVQEIINRINPC